MKDFIFEQLSKVFDLMITFEFTRTLKTILKEYCLDLKETDLNHIVAEKALDTHSISSKLLDILVCRPKKVKFYGESTYYHITPGHLLKFSISEIDIQSVNLILQKINSRYEFIQTFILNLLNFFLSYLGFKDKEVSGSKNQILRNINSLLLEKRSNLRGICYYLVQVIHSNDLLPKASFLIEKIKNSKLEEHIDTHMLQSYLSKKVKQLPDHLRPPESEDDFLILSDQDFFSREFQIIIPEFSDRDICKKFLEEFKSKDITTMRRLLKAIKRYSKLMTMSHTKGLYYPIDLLSILEFWMAKNFGLIEIEFQINVLRMIVGNLEDVKVLIHLIMLETFSKTEKENNFMQLFINSLTVDIEITKPNAKR